ncbi:BTAD domain-containing putative transcriptional regulator [Deinococcus yavapaiensis]|uniref:AAA ATPase-like protein n=1 Tax=Deinococcus yavapaiensis KR-236 TaxID=694435 RepID=A0A318SFB5_9DEIO|nr:BTAD domain-containing putative transcriptional regulator [Deinococcus yavapaiensis]PYE55402.1 AAA ATPase-like protein [Deinococcus yavapaiensis KR-236]
MQTWNLRLLGSPSLTAPDGRDLRLERKTVGLLAYLALEGATSRAALAELLWPDTVASSGRNNLVHVLRRAKSAFGTALVEGADELVLAEAVRVDARELLGERFAGDVPLGEFLSGVEFDDLPELSDWLLAWREELGARRVSLLSARASEAEREGRVADALSYATRLVDLDPLAESAYRLVMRLHAAAGDRPAALRVYHRCKDVLERELGVRPSEETARLARAIDQGELPRAPSVSTSRPLPLAVLRPPVLVGREAAWAQLEAAWQRGQTIYVTGDPGVGKTRFVQDFVTSKGRALYLPGRPGAQDVPFAAAAHNARARLTAAPDVTLPPWVRRELARVLPEFRGSDAPAPIDSPEARLNYFLAHLEVVRRTSQGFAAIINDDVQYYDAASVELGAFFLTQSRELGVEGDVPRHILIYRRGSLPEATRARQDALAKAGVAAVIELEPLGEHDVEALLDEIRASTTFEAPQGLARELHGLTNGNPQFLLETLKHMFQSGDFRVSDALRERASGATRLIAERASRLSEPALQAARAAAVLRDDFTLEVVAEVLGVGLLDLASAWEELEGAHVMLGERFSHDLVHEAVLSGTPDAIRTLLHRSAARVLPKYDAHPGRVAQHWLNARDLRQAAPWLVKAGEAAEATSRPTDAAAFYARAAQVFRELGDVEGERAAAARERTVG